MATGVHHPGRLRCVVDAVNLGYWQRIHVEAEKQGRSRHLSVEHSDHAGLPNLRPNSQSQDRQFLRHHGRRAHFVKSEFRMPVQVTATSHHGGLKIFGAG